MPGFCFTRAIRSATEFTAPIERMHGERLRLPAEHHHRQQLLEEIDVQPLHMRRAATLSLVSSTE